MCRAFEEVREEGRMEGRKEGRKEGRMEGLKEGRQEMKLDFAKNLISHGKFSLEEIARLTELSLSTVKELAEAR